MRFVPICVIATRDRHCEQHEGCEERSQPAADSGVFSQPQVRQVGSKPMEA